MHISVKLSLHPDTAPTCCWGWFPWTHRGRSLAGSWWWKRQSWTPFRSTRRAAVECCASLLCYNKVKSPYSSQFQGWCQRNADHMHRMLDKQADMYINMPTTLWGEEIICRGAPHLKITTCSRVSNNKLCHLASFGELCVFVREVGYSLETLAKYHSKLLKLTW